MSKKRIIWTFVLIAIVVGVFYGYREYTRTNKKLNNVKPDFGVTADALIKEFETADSIAFEKYDEKVIEVTGPVKSLNVENFTILLGDSSKLSVVKCELDTSFRKDATLPPVGTTIAIKGLFVGFEKDELLGTDISLKRCVLAVKTKE
jgi:hypothetical protein